MAAKNKFAQVLTDFNTFVDGVGFAGIAKKVTLPEVVFKTLELDLTGNAGAFETLTGAIEKLESEIELSSVAVDNIWPLVGTEDAAETPVIFRGSIRDGTTDVAYKITMQGIWKSVAFNDLEKGAEVSSKFKLSLRKFVVEVDDVEKVYINKLTWEIRINGIDRGGKIKSNLGLS